jgi:PilZ domain-containing protein
VKKRIGDRRARPRFEIVGILTGTLETWQHLRLLNLAAGGALVEAATPLLLGSRVNGRVVVHGQGRDIKAVVNRVEADGAGRSFRIAVEWGQPFADTDSILTTDVEPDRRSSPRDLADRRRAKRVIPASPSEIQWPTWSTVELIDISVTGVLFTSQLKVPVGETGQLRMRLGDRAFNAEVEIRRDHRLPTRHTGFPLGAVFTSLDDANRLALDDFLGGQRA